MHPSRAAKTAATLGAALLLLAVLLRLISIGYTTSTLGRLLEPEQPEPPFVGEYQIISGGAEIRFMQSSPQDPRSAPEWYSMAVEGGPITPAGSVDEDDRSSPFRLSDGVLYRRGAGENSLTQISSSGEYVSEAALSPDGTAIAFTGLLDAPGRARLYVFHLDGVLEWLGEEPFYQELHWSPDGSTLLFLAPRQGFDQIFLVGSHGEAYGMLTSGPSQKANPRWSPDGSLIAYLALTGPAAGDAAASTPTPDPRRGEPPAQPETVDVFVTRPDGADTHKLAEIPPLPYSIAAVLEDSSKPESARLVQPPLPYTLDWITHDNSFELAYSAHLPGSPSTVYLYAVPAQGGSARRVYPPVMIDALECPPAFPVEGPASARLTLTSSGLVPVDLPLVLREQHLPFTIGDVMDYLTARIAALLARGETAETASGAGRERIETITLLPGEMRVVDWPSQAEPGARLTRLTAFTGSEHPFPIAGLTCTAPNTYHGLPNLPFLGLTLPLAALGMLLCVPRLLQLKEGRWWAVWAAVPFLFWMMILVETRINIGG